MAHELPTKVKKITFNRLLCSFFLVFYKSGLIKICSSLKICQPTKFYDP
jgi:hypothetical protein